MIVLNVGLFVMLLAVMYFAGYMCATSKEPKRRKHFFKKKDNSNI